MPRICSLALLIISISLPLYADGFVIFPPAQTPLSVKYHKVTCTIDNGVAVTTVDQEFVNSLTDALTGGRYIFPVPPKSMVDQFKVTIDGETKTATVMEKAAARTFFTEAVKSSNMASLLEYTENSAYSVELASIPAGATRRIQISYVEVLTKSDGITCYRYPLNTEKYSMRLIDTVSVAVTIKNSSAITSVFSPSFPVVVSRTDDHTVTATYMSVKSRPDRDFDLYYKLSEDAISMHLFAYRELEKDGYFLLLITPKIVQPSGNEIVAKDMVFTIDQSGSMAGTKIVQAKNALQFCVNRLQPVDFFNIVAFQSTVNPNAVELLQATGENIAATQTFISGIAAQGGTNIAEALKTALGKVQPSNRPHYCIFLTDGQATVGVTATGEICNIVNAANTNGTRIFSVGFGFDVNTVLIDKLSIDNGGFPLYCNPDQNIEEVISDLYKKLETPVMTSPKLAIDVSPISSMSKSIDTWGISPEKLTDLFSGSEIAIYGRYKQQNIADITLIGNTGKKIDTLRYTTSFPDLALEYSFLPRLWATQQISHLLSRIKLSSLSTTDIQPLKDSVIALSKEYGIVTPYTSSVFVQNGGGSWERDLQVTSGAMANSASNYMQGMQQNSNAAQTIVADTNAVSYVVAPQTNQMQNAGNKLFVYTKDSIWYDATFDSTRASDTVYYGSEKYFSLATQSAEFREYLAVGSQVAFNVKGQNYLVLAGTVGVRKPRTSQMSIAQKQSLRIACVRSGMQFTRSIADGDATVELYAINGCRKSVVSLTRGATGVAMDKVLPGSYIAVYRSAKEHTIMKFIAR